MSELLQRRHLVCAEECRRRELVRGHIGAGNAPGDVRLGPDFVYWVATDDAVLGGRKCGYGVGGRDVGHCADYV